MNQDDCPICGGKFPKVISAYSVKLALETAENGGLDKKTIHWLRKLLIKE